MNASESKWPTSNYKKSSSLKEKKGFITKPRVKRPCYFWRGPQLLLARSHCSMFTLMQTHLLAKTMTVSLCSLTDLFFVLWGVTTPIVLACMTVIICTLGFLSKLQNGWQKSKKKKKNLLYQLLVPKYLMKYNEIRNYWFPFNESHRKWLDRRPVGNKIHM